MMAASLGVWLSSAQPQRRGYELRTSPLLPHEIAAVLPGIDPVRIADGAFLLVPVAATDQTGIVAAIRATDGLNSVVRVCLAIDHATLNRCDPHSMESKVGLVLDRVDVSTPPSAVIHGAIEAIRFTADFVLLASRGLRVGIALGRMQDMAEDLGLVTLGPSNGKSANQMHSFHYVPGHCSGALRPAFPRERDVAEDLGSHGGAIPRH